MMKSLTLMMRFLKVEEAHMVTNHMLLLLLGSLILCCYDEVLCDGFESTLFKNHMTYLKRALETLVIEGVVFAPILL